MKRIFAIVACFLLLGCRSVPVSETIAQGAKETISVAYDTLPKECKTSEMKRLVSVAQKQIDEISESCKTEKEVLKGKLHQSYLMSVILGLVLAFFVFKRR